MQYTSNQHKSIQDLTYIHTEGPSASYLAVSAISAEPQRVGRDLPLSPDYSDNRNLSRLLHRSTRKVHLPHIQHYYQDPICFPLCSTYI